jgi:hypothetical protein
MRWERSHHLFLGVGTPMVGLPQPPSMAPPWVGTTYAYLACSTPIIRLSRLPGKPRGELFIRGTAEVSVGT